MIITDLVILVWKAKNPNKLWKDLTEDQKIEFAYLLGWGAGNAYALPSWDEDNEDPHAEEK